MAVAKRSQLAMLVLLIVVASAEWREPKTPLPRACHALSKQDAKAIPYSTVTDFAKLRGWSTSVPLSTAVW